MTLWVQDADGNWSDAARETVYVNQSFDTEPTFVARKGNGDLSLIFDANLNFSDGPYDVSSIIWNFGDGQFGYETQYIEHYFDAPGEYVVSFQAREVDGEYKTVYKTVTVGAETIAPIANFTIDGNFTVGGVVSFDATTSIPNAEGDMTYRWNFRDGTYFEEVGNLGSFVEYSFNEVGNYQVELVVTNSQGLSEQYSASVPIEEGNNGNLAPTADFFCEPNARLTCFSTSTDPEGDFLAYEWSVNGQVFNSENISVLLAGNEFVDVSLTVFDGNGNQNTKQTNIFVNEKRAIVAEISCNVNGTNYSCSSSESFDPEGEELTKNWKINGSIVSSDESISGSESELKLLEIELILESSDGRVNSTSAAILVSQIQKKYLQLSFFATKPLSQDSCAQHAIVAMQACLLNGNWMEYLWIRIKWASNNRNPRSFEA